ncbi:MAG: UpxY family transcription antiterminator [Bacteroidales bacterium]|jgi:transcription antitermination factor NusG|nr:UpxY family transcription antiterminator [Bacteroidales bacterium]MEE1272449.1 UpxY family transcription antiterminator [Bacteroidales bacterium]
MLHKDNEVLWYAMRVPYRNELKVQLKLQEKGIETFIPKRKKIVKKRGKISYELLPAVNNLIFVHSSLSNIKDLKQEILNLQYLVNKSENKSVKIVVRDNEMQSFIKAVENLEEEITYLSPEEINIDKGTRVRIIGGNFDGVEGIFVKVKGKRNKKVVVMLDKLLAVVIAEVDSDLIEVIKN